MTTYREVNAAWPKPYPVPTPQEAIAGVKRLIRLAHRLAIEDGAVPKFSKVRKFRFKITSGNRHSYPRHFDWPVNPNMDGYWGWHAIVHSVSHWAGNYFWPKEAPHSPRHVWIEKELADYAIKNLIAGQLRRPEKAKPDPVTKRAHRVREAIKRWEAKKRRAENALRKLRKQARYYDGRLGDTGVPAARAADDADRSTDSPALAA